MNQREAAIELRLAKAKRLLQEVPVLQEHGFYGTVISRLYYACLNATRALLLTKNLVTKTHRGVSSLLHQHFIETGIMTPDKGAFLNRLMQKREQEDYGEEGTSDPYVVSELIEMTIAYVAYVETLIPKGA